MRSVYNCAFAYSLDVYGADMPTDHHHHHPRRYLHMCSVGRQMADPRQWLQWRYRLRFNPHGRFTWAAGGWQVSSILHWIPQKAEGRRLLMDIKSPM